MKFTIVLGKQKLVDLKRTRQRIAKKNVRNIPGASKSVPSYTKIDHIVVSPQSSDSSTSLSSNSASNSSASTQSNSLSNNEAQTNTQALSMSTFIRFIF